VTFADKAIKYFTGLKNYCKEIENVQIINPYKSQEVRRIVREFFKKFFNDDNERIFIIGINPGRFGGGLTGITFTDPVALRESCGIKNNLGNRRELSSRFFYTLIDFYGGTEKFYSRFFLTALFPFALICNGKNYNYYDSKSLAENLRNDIYLNIKKQISFGARNDLAIVLGKKNAEYFSQLNNKHNFFKKIIVLEHPRYIMQYKLKHQSTYLTKYLSSLNNY